MQAGSGRNAVNSGLAVDNSNEWGVSSPKKAGAVNQTR